MRRHLVLLGVALIALSVFATGCASSNSAAMKRESFVMSNPDLSDEHSEAILKGQIMLGMSEEMVQASWGSPVRIEAVSKDEAASDDPAVTHWIYGNYFLGGSLTSLYFDNAANLVRYEVEYEPGGTGKGTPGDTASDILPAGGVEVQTRDEGIKP